MRYNALGFSLHGVMDFRNGCGFCLPLMTEVEVKWYAKAHIPTEEEKKEKGAWLFGSHEHSGRKECN